MHPIHDVRRLVRRVTSVLLVVYMFAYVAALGSADQGPVIFLAHLRGLQAPLFKMLEIALIGAATYHAADGLGMMIVRRHNTAENRRLAAQIAWIITAIMVVGHLPVLMAA